MKTLKELNGVEKAKLLHQLFPEEIPETLQFVKGVCDTILENEDGNSKQWDNAIFTFEFWLSLLREVSAKIDRYGHQLHKSHHLFGDQLFDGYLALYMAHCLSLYTKTRKHPNPKFSLAIALFFEP